MSLYAYAKNDTLYLGDINKGVIKTMHHGQVQTCSIQNETILVVLKNGAQLIYEIKHNDVVLKRSFAI